MKAILISIRPQWVEKILNGIKKDEIRKGTAIGKAINKLIIEQGVAPMLIYCCKNKLSLAEILYKDGWVYDAVLNYDYAKSIGCAKKKLNGKVVARFNATAEHIEYETCSRDISGWWKDNGKMYDHKDACLTYEEMFNYIGAGEGTVVHINNLEIFDKPKDISEFYHYTTKRDNVKGIIHDYEELARAPQSYCYVEEDQ